MDAVAQLSSTVDVESACDALGVPRASFYRRRPRFGPPLEESLPAPVIRPIPDRALSAGEREGVLAVLNSERFQDCAPAAIHATLLDEGQYRCSVRTMYRVLEENGGTRERRDQLLHPQYRNFWPRLPISCGVGISPNCVVRSNGPTSISTSSWTFSAVTWLAGCWLPGKAPNWLES
jgi:hypothetical protein